MASVTPDAATAQQWYKGQVLFLTGATGTLGGCLLYKLAVQLPTRKIFIFCRGSISQALEKLDKSMPDEIHEILDTNKVTFVVGDLTKPDLGLRSTDLIQLQQEVTVVINCAANVSLRQELRESMVDNCLSHLSLIDLLSTFAHLRVLLHVSTAYVNSFLPSGPVYEDIYCIHDGGDQKDDNFDDIREEVMSIVSTGESRYDVVQFAAPYALAKYLVERLLLSKKDKQHSTIIVRPSNIGPAIRHPYPFYGFDMTIPVHSYFQFLMGSDEHGLEQLRALVPPDQVIDEIPVDLVANTCLLHLAAGTTGIVHASSKLCISYTVAKVAVYCISCVSPALREEVVQRAGVLQDHDLAANFFRMLAKSSRNWDFDCARSNSLKQVVVSGPLSLGLEGHDPEEFLRVRIRRVAYKFRKSLSDASQ